MEKMIQITSGRGPVECCWVVAQVLRVILEEAKSNGLEAFVLWIYQQSKKGNSLRGTKEIAIFSRLKLD